MGGRLAQDIFDRVTCWASWRRLSAPSRAARSLSCARWLRFGRDDTPARSSSCRESRPLRQPGRPASVGAGIACGRGGYRFLIQLFGHDTRWSWAGEAVVTTVSRSASMHADRRRQAMAVNIAGYCRGRRPKRPDANFSALRILHSQPRQGCVYRGSGMAFEITPTAIRAQSMTASAASLPDARTRWARTPWGNATSGCSIAPAGRIEQAIAAYQERSRQLSGMSRPGCRCRSLSSFQELRIPIGKANASMLHDGAIELAAENYKGGAGLAPQLYVLLVQPRQ